MKTARVFRSGKSQAVRLPKQFRLKSKEVEIFRRGNEIVLREKETDMTQAFDLLASLPDDLTLFQTGKKTFLTSAKACNGPGLPARHKYLHLHPPETAGGGSATFRRLRPGEAALSVITYGELLYGAAKSSQPQAALERLRELAHFLPALPLPETAGETYEAIRAELESKGERIGNNDLWIAAHAMASGLTLVTNNEKEFRRVRGLKVQNWAS